MLGIRHANLTSVICNITLGYSGKSCEVAAKTASANFATGCGWHGEGLSQQRPMPGLQDHRHGDPASSFIDKSLTGCSSASMVLNKGITAAVRTTLLNCSNPSLWSFKSSTSGTSQKKRLLCRNQLPTDINHDGPHTAPCHAFQARRYQLTSLGINPNEFHSTFGHALAT